VNEALERTRTEARPRGIVHEHPVIVCNGISHSQQTVMHACGASLPTTK
jgi:hypothetical protein